MNKELAEVIKIYATQDHRAVLQYLLDKSKDGVHAVLLDLLTLYFNDRNSSTLREYILVTLSGFEANEAKTGYNGYRQVTIDGRRVTEACEAKPKNINTNDARLKKLNGAGSFNDYTFARLAKHKQENATVIVGGFIDGKLIYMCRFAFDSPLFTDRLRAQLLRKYPDGKDITGDWLRSANFRLQDYCNVDSLQLEVFVSKTELAGYKKYITAPLYNFIERGL